MDRCHLKEAEGDTPRGAVRSGLQHSLAAADGREEGTGSFVVLVAGSEFGGAGDEIRASVQPLLKRSVQRWALA